MQIPAAFLLVDSALKINNTKIEMENCLSKIEI